MGLRIRDTENVQDKVVGIRFRYRGQLDTLTPNDTYTSRTATTSKRSFLYIYSTNIRTEHFKHGIYSPFFSLQNSMLKN